MKRRNNPTKNLAFCGILSALGVVIMLTTIFPYLDFSIPVIASIIVAVIIIEMGYRWAILSYATISTLSMLLCTNKEAAMMFVGIFGLYPVIKSFCESKIKVRTIEYILKFLYFNLGIVISYSIIVFVLGIPFEGLEILGKFTIPILLFVLNLVFLVYDLALTNVLTLYIKNYKGKFFKL